MSYETILLDIHGRVGLITLNRPQALNALNAQLVSEVNQALDALEANDVRIRIGGSGRVRTWVHHKLDVTIGGSGEIEFYGDPVITKTIGGSGRLVRLGAAPQ